MILKVLNFLFIAFEVLVIFNLLIIVHELGHFLAARWRGLYADRFAIWFGKPIWQKKIGGVTYILGSIPAGGFVSLPQMSSMEAIEGSLDIDEEIRRKLKPAPALDKIIVAFAGPLFSMMLAIVFATIVWVVGRPTSESETTTTIGYVQEDSPAERAGLKAGDKVLEVDGYPVTRFAGMVNSITWRVIRSEGTTIPFKIERDGVIKTLYAEWVKEPSKRFGRASLRQVRIGPKTPTVIDEVEPSGPAAKAGLQHGDVVTEINGAKIYSHVALLEEITKHPDQPVTLGILRDGKPMSFSIQPALMKSENGEQRARIGILWDIGKLELVHPLPSQQIVDSVSTMINMIGALVSPKSDVKAQHFSGPVGIMRLYYMMFESEQGWRMALWFSVLFNVNLAVINMLPIPVLDGGHILLAVIEGIRRRPVNVKVVEAVTGVCAFVIISFMLYVTFFDVQDLPFFGKRDRVERATPAPVEQK